MKKIRMILIASGSLLGLLSSFAFNSPRTIGGWKGGKQYVKGTLPGQYTCNTAVIVTCTFTNQNQNVRFDTGTFILH